MFVSGTPVETEIRVLNGSPPRGPTSPLVGRASGSGDSP